MSRKLISYDPETGIAKWFHYDETNDTFTIQTEMQGHAVEDIVEANKAAFNEAQGQKFGDGKLVARIPIHLYWDLKKKGIADDDEAMKRWLNDPDNRFFRTFPGQV